MHSTIRRRLRLGLRVGLAAVPLAVALAVAFLHDIPGASATPVGILLVQVKSHTQAPSGASVAVTLDNAVASGNTIRTRPAESHP